jgi:hypothetical protein
MFWKTLNGYMMKTIHEKLAQIVMKYGMDEDRKMGKKWEIKMGNGNGK